MRFRAATIAVVLLSAAILSLGPATFQAAPSVVGTQTGGGVPGNPDQSHTGSVAGRVTDKSGQPVVGASLVLQDSVTEDSWATTSGEQGVYKFTALFPGAYTIQAEKNGRQSEKTPVKVDNGKASRQDLVVN